MLPVMSGSGQWHRLRFLLLDALRDDAYDLAIERTEFHLDSPGFGGYPIEHPEELGSEEEGAGRDRFVHGCFTERASGPAS